MNAADPLARYAARRDAEAFATLVGDYQSMVLATCRRQVRSPGDVDDAVQETFLKLAKNAGTLRQNVAAWLHRCAVNVSADLNRRGETRRRHELAASEFDADVDARQELAELREHLDAALEKLDDASRELILQRFFVGRSQVDIAKDEGVTPSAISQRLDRAIAALRKHLAASGAISVGGGLAMLLSAEQASAVVAPAMTAKINAIGLAGAPTIVAGAGVAAGAWAGAAAAVVIAGAAVGATVWFRHQVATPAAAVVASTQPSGGMTIRGDAAIDSTPAAPAWAAQPSATGGVLSGRITDADGKPVVGANVLLSNVRAGLVKSDADGRYSIAAIARDGEYRLAVTADGFAPIYGDYSERDVPLRLAKGAQAQRDVILQRAVKVTIVVDDAAGAALQDLRVEYIPVVEGGIESRSRIMERSANPSAEGLATVSIPVGTTPYAIIASAKDHAPQFVTIVPRRADEPMNVPITLERGTSITGTALCSDGKPGTGWSIFARPVTWPGRSYPYQGAKIDADGTFTIPNAVPGTFDVSYNIPTGDGMSTSRSLGQFELAADKPLALSIPMKSPGSLAKITANVKWVGDVDSNTYCSVQASSLGDGRNRYFQSLRYDSQKGRNVPLTIGNVEPGEYQVRVDGPQVETVVLERVKVPGDVPDIELRVAKESMLAGIVTDADTGKPIPNFAFRLRKLSTIGKGANYQPSRDWTQVGDRDGAFTTKLVGPGEYQVQISAAGYARTWSDRVRVETPGANGMTEVKLSRGGTVRGVVLDASGTPVAGAKVIPFSMAQSPVVEHADVSKRFSGEAGAAITDASGKYELNNLPAGSETLKIVHPSFAPKQLDAVAVGDGKTSDAPTVTLKVGATIAGVVYDADGKPAPNVAVQLMDAPYYNGDEESGIVAQATTDADGKYRVAGVPEMMLWANLADRWQRGGVVRRAIRPLGDAAATLDLGGANALTGRIVPRDGNPLAAETRIVLSTSDQNFGAFMANAKPDADGRFAIRGVPAGRYMLYAGDPRGNGRGALREVTVGNGPLDLGDLADDRGRASLALTADDPADLAAVTQVTLMTEAASAGYDNFIGQFRKDGDRWVCDDVPPGRSVVRVLGKDYQTTGQITVDRKAGEAEQSISLALPKRSATLQFVPSATPTKAFSRVVDAAGVPWLYLGGGEKRAVAVPPGTYRITAGMTSRPRDDLEPIVARAGETIDVVAPAVAAQAAVQVYVWAADGAMRTDLAVALVDAGGQAVAATPWMGHERTIFALSPGRYTARVERAGKPTVEQSIVVPDGVSSLEPIDRHVALPD